MMAKIEEIMTQQLQAMKLGFDKLFFSLQTNFTKLISALQNVGATLVKALIRPEAFIKSVTGQPQGKGKAAGSSADIFTLVDSLITSFGKLKGFDDDTKMDSGGGVETQKPTGFINVFGDMLKSTKKPLDGMRSQFAALGPQAMLASIALQPIQELLTAMLEPLEPLSDMFSQFGTLLGQMFIPVMQTIMPFLQSMMPLFDAVGQALGPIIQLLFQFSGVGMIIQIIQPFIPLITMLAQLFAQVMNALAPLLTIISNLINLMISTALSSIMIAISDALKGLGVNLGSITQGIANFANAIKNLVDKIMGFINTISGQSIKDWKLFNSKENGGWW